MSELTPPQFDAMVKPRAKRELPTWTLPAIGQLINAGPDLVRTLTKAPGSPIHCVGGKWYCYESELIEWMKNPPKPM
ncbi:MAG: hypothetical protein ACOH2N_04655 [Devosia sp.]